MVNIRKNNKIKYVKIHALKVAMSQMFDQNAKVLPYTELRVVDDKDIDRLKKCTSPIEIVVSGISKGRGFAGTVKKWGFRAGPKSHGHLKPRSPGSIGAQGQRRVIPGKKMPGNLGNEKVTT